MAIEIVDLPIYKMVIFHSKLLVYQRVMIFMGFHDEFHCFSSNVGHGEFQGIHWDLLVDFMVGFQRIHLSIWISLLGGSTAVLAVEKDLDFCRRPTINFICSGDDLSTWISEKKTTGCK